MTLRMSCPSCGRQLLLDDQQTGRSVACPSCGNVVSPASASRSEGIATQPRATPWGEDPQRAAPRRRSRPTESRGGKAGLVLGILTLVVGIAALSVSWMPVVCILSLICAGFGLLLGFAGFLTALIQRRFLGLGFSLVGGALNLLALCVALFVMILSGGLFPSMRIDAFNEPPAGAALPQWGQVFDPDGDCTVEQKGPTLSLHVPPTAHDLSAELGLVNSPRVLQEVEGDFVAQVKVCGTIHPTARPVIPGRISCQSAGLLLWDNPRNYIRLERAALIRDGVVQSYASLERRAHAWPIVVPPVGLPEQDIYLRLERRGDQILGSVSGDGKQWMLLQAMNATLPSKVRVGVAAVNAAQQPLQIRFKDYAIQKK